MDLMPAARPCYFALVISVMATRPDRSSSRYAVLEKPEFKSSIPPHLVNKLSEHEKWLCEAISIIQAQNEWLIEAALESNRIHIESDIRIQEVQDWKAMFSSKWTVIAGFFLLLIPVALKSLLEHYLKP